MIEVHFLSVLRNLPFEPSCGLESSLQSDANYKEKLLIEKSNLNLFYSKLYLKCDGPTFSKRTQRSLKFLYLPLLDEYGSASSLTAASRLGLVFNKVGGLKVVFLI